LVSWLCGGWFWRVVVGFLAVWWLVLACGGWFLGCVVVGSGVWWLVSWLCGGWFWRVVVGFLAVWWLVPLARGSTATPLPRMATHAQWACRIGASDRTYLYGVAGRPFRPARYVSGDLTDQSPSRARGNTDYPKPARPVRSADQSPLTCIAGRRPATNSLKSNPSLAHIRQAHKPSVTTALSGVAVTKQSEEMIQPVGSSA
jgi:hypothetical protein